MHLLHALCVRLWYRRQQIQHSQECCSWTQTGPLKFEARRGEDEGRPGRERGKFLGPPQGQDRPDVAKDQLPGEQGISGIFIKVAVFEYMHSMLQQCAQQQERQYKALSSCPPTKACRLTPLSGKLNPCFFHVHAQGLTPEEISAALSRVEGQGDNDM